MSLADLGNIGEFVGAIAVFVSFIYLAYQIRQNTKAVNRTENNAALNQWSQYRAMVLHDRELAIVLGKLKNNANEIDEVEQVQLDMLLEELFNIGRHQYDRNREGFGAPTDWTEQTKPFLVDILSKDLASSWWERNREGFPTDYRHELDT